MKLDWQLLFVIIFKSLTDNSIAIKIEVEQQFKNFVFIHENGFGDDFQEDLIKYAEPKVIIRCPREICTLVNQQTEGLKQYPRYGPHRYTHIFYKVQSNNIINHWKELYGQLTLTKSKVDFFHHTITTYRKYAYYDVNILMEDYWRSQWNQDEFIIIESHQLIYHALQEYENLPTRLQKSVKFGIEISDYAVRFYSTLSGWGGSRCKFYTRVEQLYALTVEFNAYDTLFCNVFEYHNLTFTVNYFFLDHRWMRGFLLRDDLMSSFPPDPKAVFYGSPGVTFIVLKEPPITWDNIFRPFSYFLWAGIGVSAVIITIISLTFSKIGDHLRLRYKFVSPSGFNPVYIDSSKDTGTERIWIIFVRIFKFIIMATYGGMILAGILDPSYPWSPTTFKELNVTSNYIAATAYNSPVNAENLINSFTLNGMRNWQVRTENDPGNYLILDEKDEANRYALLMYDDKKFHYIYGKSQLYFTANYTHNIEADKEVVLKEMRYVSAAPGATRLHFLIDGIKRCFESGCWMRWKYLEENYFKYVAPNTIKGYGIDWFDREPQLRSLNKLDILTTIYIWAVGMGVSLIGILIELKIMHVSIFRLIFGGFVAKGFAFIVLIFVKCCLCSSYRLQKVREWLLDCH